MTEHDGPDVAGELGDHLAAGWTFPAHLKEQLDALRADFTPDQIGKLPRTTCRACSDARGGACNEHGKGKCGVCGQWMTTRHTHLDFVGHADVTNRLLDVDPLWSWAPIPDPAGLGYPVVPGGMWIYLTVCGVTRPGFGDAGGKTGPNAVKELIGDALRNAAMRFGVALDLWIKGQAEDDEKATATSERSGPERSQPAKTISAKDMIPAKDAKDRLVEAASGDMDAAAAAWTGAELGQARQITPDQMAAALAKISDPRAANEAFSEAIRERRHATEQGQFVESGK